MDDDPIAQLRAENARLRADNERLEALFAQRASAGDLRRESIDRRYFDPGAILDEAVDFISTADLSGRVSYLNRVGRRLVGIDETADIGQFRIADMHPPWANDLIASEAIPIALRGGVWRGETALTTRDGREIPVSQIVLAHRTPQGEVKFLSTIARDITEQKLAQERLAWEARVNAALAEVSRALLARMPVDDMAYLVLEHAKNLTGSSYGFVGHIDPATGYLVTSTLSRDIWDACQVQGKTFVFKEFNGLFGWVLNHRQSLLTNAPAADPRSSGTPPGHIPIQRFVGAPALAGGTLVGQVALANADRDYTEQDLTLLERLADLYAVAVQRWRTEESLRESEERFAAFMDHLPAAAFIKDDQSRHLYVNKYLEDHFDARNWLDRNSAEVFPAELVEALRINDRKVLREGMSEFEETMDRTDGETRCFRVIKFPMRTSAASSLIGGIAIDITERKRTEETLRASEAQLRHLIEASPMAMGLSDLRGNIEYLNARHTELFGYRREDISSVEKWFLRAYPDPIYRQDVLDNWTAGMEDAKRNGTDVTLTDIEVVCRDGSVRVVAVIGSLIGDKILAIFNDVTERKQAEAALRASEEKYRLLVENQTDLIVKVDTENRFLFASPSYCEMFGKTEEELLDNTFMPLVHEDDQELTAKSMARLLQPPYTTYHEQRAFTKTGWRWLGWSAKSILDENNRVVSVVGIGRDITDRKQAESALRESEERFAAFMDNLPAVTFIKDRDSRTLFVNRHFRQLFGDGHANKSASETFPAEVAAAMIADDHRALAEGFLRREEPVPLASGETRIFETIKFPLNRTGKPTLLGGFAVDITERKQAEAELRRYRENLEEMVHERTDELVLTNRQLRLEIDERQRVEDALRNSENRLRLALEVADAGAWEWNVKTDAIAWSPEMFRLFGMQPFDRQSIFENWVERLHPDDRERVLASVQEDLARKSDLAAYKEYRIARPNGEIRWISDTAKIFYDSAEQPERMVGINIDITERKQAEEALRDSETRLRLALQAANAGVWEWDLRHDMNTTSKRFFEILGIAPTTPTLPLETLLKSIHPEDRAWAKSEAWEIVERGDDMDLEFRIVRPDGEIRWVHDLGILIHDGADRPLRMIGTMTDITERKRAEEELKNYRDHLEMLVDERTAALEKANAQLQQEIVERQRAEKSLRLTQFAVDHTADAVYWMGPDARFIYVNDAACQALGWSRKELLRMSVMDIGPDFPAEVWSGHWRELRERGSMVLDTVHKARDGKIFPVEIRANFLEFEGQEYNCAFARDITERKRAEENMLASLCEKEVLLKEIHHRVKNNLQVITSLLDLQATVIEDRATREKFRESRDRVRSMALIHERLYRNADLASIDLAEYLKNLTESLLSSYTIGSNAITLQADMEPIRISVERAVPCGLIVNELITNALKYAFPKGSAGIIGIESRMRAENRVILRVWDNGVGLPAHVDPDRAETLGLTIVATLVRQLRGDLTVQHVGGSGFTITFVDPSVKTARPVSERE